MNNVKRPPTVWITQALLVIFALLLMFTLILNIAMLLSHLNEVSSVLPALITYAITFVIVLLFAISFWGLTKAQTYGRWLGLSSMVLVWGLIILSQLLRPSGPFKYYEYDNTAQLVGAMVAQFLLHALFLILICRLAFARKVSLFFHQRATQQIVGPERGERVSQLD
jgi:hypothetical protein